MRPSYSLNELLWWSHYGQRAGLTPQVLERCSFFLRAACLRA